MRNWSEFLDLNLLRPSAFERRHIEVQRNQLAHQRHSSTSSLPQNLPSRFASFTAPVSYNLDPASPLNALHHHQQPRQSLDGRRRNASGASLSISSSQQQQQPSSQTHHTSFFSTRFLTPPASSGDESTTSRFSLTGARGRRNRGASIDVASNTSTGEDASSRRSFLRPFFNRNSSWNGQSGSSATPSSISGTDTRTQSNASRTTTTTGHNNNSNNNGAAGGSRLGQDTSNEDGNESEEERQRHQRPIKFLARPTTGIDMTPRTDRMRRRTHVDDEDLVRTAGAAADATAEGTTEVIVSVPLTIVDIPAETLPADGMSEGTVTGAGAGAGAEAAEARDSQAEPTTTQAAMAAIHGHSISRTSTASPTSANGSTTVPPTTVLQQPSLNESRTLTLPDSNGLIFQRQPTRAERRVQRQLNYLKKFMCVIATMPVIATLAVYNKFELIMWWVIALPLVGIAMALVWRRRLAVKLQRLREETDLARLSLAFAPTQSSTTRVLRQNQDNDDEPPAPPDYQSSIITPPAYIVAQQPRKVPSYRSLENLFAFARNGSRIFSRGTAAAAAATTTTESGAEEEGEGEGGEGQHEEGEANRGENHTSETETLHREDASNSHGVSVIIQMPQDSVEAPQESEQTTQHYLEHKTEESVMAQEKTDVTATTTTTTNTASTPLTAITVVPRVEIEFVQPQAYLPQSMPEMVEVGTGLGSHPTDHQYLHHYQHYQGTRSFVSTTSSSCGSSSTAHDTMHDLTLVDSFDGELQRDRRASLLTVTSLEGDWETDQDTQSAESSSLAHARHRSRDIKGKSPSRE